jgi:hypothetical protein
VKYLNYISGVFGSQTTINPNCIWYPSGNVWSIDGPTIGYLCSIVCVWVNQSAGRVAFDARALNGTVLNVNLGSTWGTAIAQSNGGYVISI